MTSFTYSSDCPILLCPWEAPCQVLHLLLDAPRTQKMWTAGVGPEEDQEKDQRAWSTSAMKKAEGVGLV